MSTAKLHVSHGTHWKCIENFHAMISNRTANCILTYGVGSGERAGPSPVKKTLNKWASVNISRTNWKKIGNSRAMHFQCVPLNFMCPVKYDCRWKDYSFDVWLKQFNRRKFSEKRYLKYC